MADLEIFEQYGVFRWVIGSFDIALPAQRISSQMRNRVIPHERIYRPGARHDDTGSKAKTWTFVFLAHNDSDEAGVPTAYYPDEVNKLEDSMEIHEVGTLYTTRGPRRCRLESLDRTEDRTQGSDACSITATWVEDNEDDATAASFQAPSARSVANAQLLLATDQLNAAGIGGGSFFASLQEAVAALVALAEGPGNTVAEIERQEQIVLDDIDQVETAYASAIGGGLTEMDSLLTDPMSAAPGRMLRRLADTCARAASEKAQDVDSTRQTLVRRYNEVMSIWQVAIDVDQDAYDLLSINGALSTPNAIPPNTPVFVFASS